MTDIFQCAVKFKNIIKKNDNETGGGLFLRGNFGKTLANKVKLWYNGIGDFVSRFRAL